MSSNAWAPTCVPRGCRSTASARSCAHCTPPCGADREIAYGNIGGSNRLDFTAIGAAVNLAARLEGLTGKLNLPLVISEAFAKSTTRPLEERGSFQLKGVAGESRVFAPKR